MRSRASLAIGAEPSLAISKNLRRRWAQQKASVIAEVSFLGAAAAGIEHWRHGLIDRDLARGQNEFAQPKIERLELGGRIAHPERQDRALDVEALREQHLGLPIER